MYTARSKFDFKNQIFLLFFLNFQTFLFKKLKFFVKFPARSLFSRFNAAPQRFLDAEAGRNAAPSNFMRGRSCFRRFKMQLLGRFINVAFSHPLKFDSGVHKAEFGAHACTNICSYTILLSENLKFSVNFEYSENLR